MFDLNIESKLKWPPLFYDPNGEVIIPIRISVDVPSDNDKSSNEQFLNVTYSNESKSNETSSDEMFPNETSTIKSFQFLNVIVVNQTDNIVTVACPGSRLQLTGQASSRFRCINNLLVPLTSDGGVQYSDLSCAKSIEEDVVASDNETCGPPEEQG